MRAYKANMIPGGTTPVINVSQYDNDYAVTVTLIEGAEIYTPPAGATIRVEGTKPDGHGFEYPCTYQGNVVTMPIYTQMTAVAGRFPIELVVYQNGLRVGSCNIVFAVEKATLGEDTDISETVLPDIIDASQASAEAAEAWAVGQRDGVDVPSTDETYHNNAKYYAESVSETVEAAEASATAAAGSASQAANSAQSANSSAIDADAAKTAAQTAAAQASTDANTASDAASSATSSASTATAAQTSASASATTATNAETNALAYRDAAAASATQAASSAASAGTAKDAAMDAAQDAIDAAQELQTAIQFNAALIHDTASGAVASFADGADNIPMKSIVAEITPVQSGTGDPSPTNIRPISGRTGMTVTRAGKNLAKFANQILDADRTQNGVTFHALNESTVRISGTATGSAYLTGSQSYEQLVSENHFYKAGTYTMSSNLLHNASNYAYLTGFEFDGTPISRNIVTNVYDGHPVTFTMTSDFYANIQMSIQSGSDFSNGVDTWVQIAPDSTATTYEPYAGQTYPITWESIAGTVYGGTLDVVSGVLTVDSVGIILDGTTHSFTDRSNYWHITPADYGEIKTHSHTTQPEYVLSSFTMGVSKWGTTGYELFTRASNWTNIFNSVDDINNFITVTPQQVVLPLATPQTYQLTPTEVRTILGGNTIYTDAGSVTVEYVADTKLYIDNKIAELQALVLEN